MRRTGDTWEYIATYVDDLAMALKNPTEVTNALCNKYGYKLKGVGPITYQLGSDYKRLTVPYTSVLNPTSKR